MGIQDKAALRINLPYFSAVFAVLLVILLTALVIESDARSGRKRITQVTDTDAPAESGPLSGEQTMEEQAAPEDGNDPVTPETEDEEVDTEPVPEEDVEGEGAGMGATGPAAMNTPEGEAGEAVLEQVEDEAKGAESAGMGVNSTAATNTPSEEDSGLPPKPVEEDSVEAPEAGDWASDPAALNSPDAGGGTVVNDVEHSLPATTVNPAAMLNGIEAWELLGNNAMIDDLYDVKAIKKEKMDGSEVTITVRQARYDEMSNIAIAPMTLVTISSNGLEVRHPLYHNRRMEFEYSLPASSPQILAINERCGCEDPYGDLVHLFTVYRKAIRPLGALSGIADADGDGLLEPFVYDTAFSNGLGLIESDRAPVVRVYLSVDRGRLVAERGKYESFYRSKIDALSEIIARDRSESPGSGDLAPVLEKFLYHKAMVREKEGWQALEKDLTLYDGRTFPQQRGKGVAPEKFTVEEIVSRMRKALGKGWKVSN